MRKLVDRLICGPLLWPLLWIAWGVYAFAGETAPGQRIHLDVDGREVVVEVANRPESAVVDREGEARTVLLWTADDARRIREALEIEGLSYALADVLGGLRPGRRDPLCIMLLLPDGTEERVEVVGRPGVTARGRIAWSSDQLRYLASALDARGWGEIVPELVGLRQGAAVEVAATSAAAGPTPLDPKCGECLNGGPCQVAGKERCCGGASGCMACKVCIRVAAMEAEP